MPIPQSRLISLVAIADDLLSIIDQIRADSKATIREATTIANGGLAQIDDPQARATIRQLLQTTSILTNNIEEMDIPQSLRDNVAEERIHFKKTRKANENLAIYYRLRRQAKREQEKTVQVFADLPPAAPQSWQTFGKETATPLPDYNSPEAIASRLATYEAARKAERATELTQKIIEDAKEIEELAKKERPLTPPGESISIEQAKAEAKHIASINAKREGKILEPEIKSEPQMRPATYDPSVIAFSLPTNEELNKAPTKPGENIL